MLGQNIFLNQMKITKKKEENVIMLGQNSASRGHAHHCRSRPPATFIRGRVVFSACLCFYCVFFFCFFVFACALFLFL